MSVRDVTERPVRDVTERPRIVGIHQTAELAVHPDVNAHVLLECPLSVNHDRFSHKLFDNILKSLELLCTQVRRVLHVQQCRLLLPARRAEAAPVMARRGREGEGCGCPTEG